MKITIFILSLFLSASCISKPLTIYYCNNFAEAEMCSASCGKAPKGDKYDPKFQQKVEFLISEKTQSIMLKSYFGSEFNSSRVLKNCKIFDEKNWDCSEEPMWIENAKWLVYQEEKMNNGIYVHGLYNSKETKYKSIAAVCAK